MMPPLWLDYRHQRPGRQRPGWTLLIIAVLVTVALLARQAMVAEDLAAVQSELARTSAASAMATERAGGAAAPVATAWWEQLFAALEAAGDESVTLLNLRPGIDGLRLEGEAVSYDAAVDYTRRLGASGTFGSVYLIQTEVVRGHPRQPVRFSLQAQWSGLGRVAS